MHSLAANPPIVLAIAGFDPGAGAGVLADIKTLAANGCYGIAVVTAMTVQNSRGAERLHAMPAALVRDQLACLSADISPKAIKIGMLGTGEMVETVADFLARHAGLPVVLDPVLTATSGLELLEAAAVPRLAERLLPHCAVITPNRGEAARLSGLEVETPAQMEAAARALHQRGAANVVITGGDLEKPTDLFFDGRQAVALGGDRIRTGNTHGTGCTFSAALAANLALGKQPLDAVVQAKAYVTAALKQSYPVGAGAGPLNHFFRWHEPPRAQNDPMPVEEHLGR